MSVHSADVHKTAIITPFGRYVFYYSTFGFNNSSATFHCMMDSIYRPAPHCPIYMDDLLVFSDNNSEHELHLEEVLSLLRENELNVRPDKCTVAATTVDFIGHRMSSDGIRPLQFNVKAIQDYSVPTTMKERHAFRDMVNYYHRFITMAADDMAPTVHHLFWRA